MLTPDFVSCALKIGRAEEHLMALQTETVAWYKSEPYTGIKKRNADGSRYSVIAEIKNKPTLERWSLLSADCLHNLRSALDHMVYVIAVRDSGQSPPPGEKSLQFPICDTPEKFAGQQWRIGGLSDRVQAAIESVQPYNRPYPDLPPLLGLLRDFNDVDKHRLLKVAIAQHVKGNLTCFLTNPKPAIHIGYKPGPVEDGAEIAWFTVDPPSLDVEFKHSAAVAICIDHATGPTGITSTEVGGIMEFLTSEVRVVIDQISVIV